MKVRITLEAEVTDLPAFNPKTSALAIPGAGRENVYDVVKYLQFSSLTKLLNHVVEKPSKGEEKRHAAIRRAYEDELKLTERLTGNVKIEYV